MNNKIFALHGFSEHPETWGNLNLEGFELMAISLEDIACLPLEEAIKSIHERLTQLADGQSFGLIGYSMGGRLALHYAMEHPLDFLILESASVGIKNEQERQERRVSDEALAQKIELNGSAWFADFWAATPIFESQKNLPQELQDKVWQSRASNDPKRLAQTLRMTGQGVLPYLGDTISQLTMPLLYLSGALDKKYTAIGETYFPEQHVIIPQAGHNIHLEAPKAFQEAIQAFLNKKSVLID
ncbi:alpha/beta fold hydrolase [Lactococcus termiticola]|uniref:Prolyl aminopeptidase n=1 Tax=Lactococcus termiticola TaxID=2169526 RepID=A0A2R5HEG4_9LACT|nr:alpha/beta fold hydrolase [Lactococcus termiticola]GBG96422.1 prolyl aminopeptidase [Lactococcus termiticola]